MYLWLYISLHHLFLNKTFWRNHTKQNFPPTSKLPKTSPRCLFVPNIPIFSESNSGRHRANSLKSTLANEWQLTSDGMFFFNELPGRWDLHWCQSPEKGPPTATKLDLFFLQKMWNFSEKVSIWMFVFVFRFLIKQSNCACTFLWTHWMTPMAPLCPSSRGCPHGEPWTSPWNSTSHCHLYLHLRHANCHKWTWVWKSQVLMNLYHKSIFKFGGPDCETSFVTPATIGSDTQQKRTVIGHSFATSRDSIQVN